MSVDSNPLPVDPPAAPLSVAPASPTPAPRRNILAVFLGMLISPRATLAYLRERGGRAGCGRRCWP